MRWLWLGGGDRAARPDGARLSPVPVPRLRQARYPQSGSLPSDIIAGVVFCRLRYRLMLRDLSEIMLLRGFTVSHECIRQWEAKLSPVMGEALRRRRHGATRDMRAAKRFFRSARSVAGFVLDRVTTDGNSSYPRAIRSTLGRKVRHRTNVYLNNKHEQHHRGIKGRIRCMRGFKEHDAADRFCREYRRTP